jgi:preprotein translocase subunit SecA
MYLSLEDELLEGLGPEKARYYKELGREKPGRYDSWAGLFRKAQRVTERRHFRDRKVLMYQEKERKKVQIRMGQDPYLDTPG